MTNDFIDHYAAHIADESRQFEGLEGARRSPREDAALRSAPTSWNGCPSCCSTIGVKFAVSAFAAPVRSASPNPIRPSCSKPWRAGGARLDRHGGRCRDDVGVAARNVQVISVDFGYTDVPMADLKPIF